MQNQQQIPRRRSAAGASLQTLLGMTSVIFALK
jgi:hypothetical protein